MCNFTCRGYDCGQAQISCYFDWSAVFSILGAVLMHYRVWNESMIVSQQCVRVHLALQTLLRVVEKLTAYAGWRVAPHDSWVYYYNHYDSYCPYMILFQPVCCGADSTSLP